MSYGLSIQEGGVSPSTLRPHERIRASDLGYSTQDIKDLGVPKIRELIKSGTVKAGKTDLQIQREKNSKS